MNKIDPTMDIVQEFLKEKRRDRRWKTLRSLLWLAFFVFIFFSIFSRDKNENLTSNQPGNGKYVALIRLNGMIAPDRETSAEEMIPILKKAFSDKNAKGVLIDINSPGGTPVQAAIIHDAIIMFKNKYKKKVIVVGEDVMASGAYFVAVAADKIYVNPNSLTGSIGVIMKGFGFVDAIKKLGIERRVYQAGDAKDRLDPFLPQNPDDLKKIQTVMADVHQNFVKAVLEGRKDKLKAPHDILFSGDFWSGSEALKLGLVDELGDYQTAMIKEFQTTTYKEFGGIPNFLRFITGRMNTAFDNLIYTVR